MPGRGTPKGRGRNQTPSEESSGFELNIPGGLDRAADIFTEQQTQSPDTDYQNQSAKQINKNKKRGSSSGTGSGGSQGLRIIIKETSGHPSEPLNTGVIEINTIDNKIFMYADGGWRQLATW